jgi:hypothetical protein
MLREARRSQPRIRAGLRILGLSSLEHLQRRTRTALVQLVQTDELGRGSVLLCGRNGSFAFVGQKHRPIEHGAQCIGTLRRHRRDGMRNPQLDGALLFCVERRRGGLTGRPGRIVLIAQGNERCGERRVHRELQRVPDPVFHERFLVALRV